jgi:hypothetical protein
MYREEVESSRAQPQGQEEAGLLDRLENTPDSPLSYRCFDRH